MAAKRAAHRTFDSELSVQSLIMCDLPESNMRAFCFKLASYVHASLRNHGSIPACCGRQASRKDAGKVGLSIRRNHYFISSVLKLGGWQTVP
jgi:hypothetical protein